MRLLTENGNFYFCRNVPLIFLILVKEIPKCNKNGLYQFKNGVRLLLFDFISTIFFLLIKNLIRFDYTTWAQFCPVYWIIEKKIT